MEPVLNFLLDLLRHVPDTVWAALLVLGGVILSNRNSRRQLQATIENDARQRDRDREMALKREVFMPAADAVVSIWSLLGDVLNPGPADTSITKRVAGLTSTLARIQVVGTNRTVQATSNFLLAFMAAYVELKLKRGLPLKPLKNRHVQLLDRLQAEVNRLREPDGVLTEAERYAKIPQIGAALLDELKRDILATLDLAQLCLTRAQELGKLVPPVIFAIREELGLPLDQQEFLNQWEQSEVRGEAIVKGVIDEAKKLLDDLQARSAPQKRE